MKEKIWYCTEDFTIYPTEKDARKGYIEWLVKNTKDGKKNYSEEIFRECYREISFKEFNEIILELLETNGKRERDELIRKYWRNT